jgi:DNA-binding NarL/FixJ family response regulator
MSNDPERITVLTVDDHPLLREGVAAVLAHERDIVVVGEAANSTARMSHSWICKCPR